MKSITTKGTDSMSDNLHTHLRDPQDDRHLIHQLRAALYWQWSINFRYESDYFPGFLAFGGKIKGT
jgi:hypothetical protein